MLSENLEAGIGLFQVSSVKQLEQEVPETLNFER
jgi:hypothetical protein